MKQKDIVVIVVVGIVAAIFSLLITQTIFVPKKNKDLTAQVVEPISSQFNQPEKSVFNPEAINPTQLIQIGDSNNASPF